MSKTQRKFKTVKTDEGLDVVQLVPGPYSDSPDKEVVVLSLSHDELAALQQVELPKKK